MAKFQPPDLNRPKKKKGSSFKSKPNPLARPKSSEAGSGDLSILPPVARNLSSDTSAVADLAPPSLDTSVGADQAKPVSGASIVIDGLSSETRRVDPELGKKRRRKAAGEIDDDELVPEADPDVEIAARFTAENSAYGVGYPSGAVPSISYADAAAYSDAGGGGVVGEPIAPSYDETALYGGASSGGYYNVPPSSSADGYAQGYPAEGYPDGYPYMQTGEGFSDGEVLMVSGDAYAVHQNAPPLSGPSYPSIPPYENRLPETESPRARDTDYDEPDEITLPNRGRRRLLNALLVIVLLLNAGVGVIAAQNGGLVDFQNFGASLDVALGERAPMTLYEPSAEPPPPLTLESADDQVDRPPFSTRFAIPKAITLSSGELITVVHGQLINEGVRGFVGVRLKGVVQRHRGDVVEASNTSPLLAASAEAMRGGVNVDQAMKRLDKISSKRELDMWVKDLKKDASDALQPSQAASFVLVFNTPLHELSVHDMIEVKIVHARLKTAP